MTRTKPQISALEMPHLDRVFRMEGGYVLDFSDRTFSSFFAEEVGVDIDDRQYHANGSSKAKRLRFFLNHVQPHIAAKALRKLLSHRSDLCTLQPPWSPATPDTPAETLSLQKVEIIIKRLEGTAPNTEGIDAFQADETLEELVADIERTIKDGKPNVALDRLHTYCMKKFAHLLTQRGDTVDKTLNARASRYFNPLRQSGKIRPISDKIMKATVAIFEDFNHVRNNESLAHDNTLVELAEARFIFDGITNVLRFIKSIEGNSFEA